MVERKIGLSLGVCPNSVQVREDLRLQSERLRALLGLVEVPVCGDTSDKTLGASESTAGYGSLACPSAGMKLL